MLLLFDNFLLKLLNALCIPISMDVFNPLRARRLGGSGPGAQITPFWTPWVKIKLWYFLMFPSYRLLKYIGNKFDLRGPNNYNDIILLKLKSISLLQIFNKLESRDLGSQTLFLWNPFIFSCDQKTDLFLDNCNVFFWK